MADVDPNLRKLPPIVDMAAYYAKWFSYETLHENAQQKPIEKLARDNQCCMFSKDLVAGKMWREFKCSGFEEMWKCILRRITRQALAVGYVGDVNSDRSIPDTIWDDLDGACFYEMVKDDMPCHLAFDIEYYTHINPLERFDQVVDALLDAVDRTFEEYYGLVGMQKVWDAVWTDSSIHVGHKPKVSRHLILRLPYNLMFADWMHVGAFARRVGVMCIKMYGHPDDNISFIADPKETYKTVLFDASPYTHWRSMRMLGNSKKGQRRPFHWFTRRDVLGKLVNVKHSFKDITRERFLQSLIQAPPSRPAECRILHCTEPDGSPAVSHGVMPFYSQGQYCFDMSDIGLGGAMANSYLCKSAAEVFDRVACVGSAASKVKYKSINEHEALALLQAPHNDDPEKLMAIFCVELGDKIASTLGVEESVLKTLKMSDQMKVMLRAPDKVAYYRTYTDTSSMGFQMHRLWCPFKKRLHKSNHIKYTLEIAPDGNRTSEPLLRARCFSCASVKGGRVRLRWWNKEWDDKRAKYFELLDSTDQVTLKELLGWLYDPELRKPKLPACEEADVQCMV